MIKFPSIEQFRTAIKNVQHRAHWAGRDEAGEPIFDRARPIPTLKLRGTVKLHGTNAGIVFSEATGWDIESFQSRERVLSLTQDNAGFMLYMSETDRQAELHDMIQHIIDLQFTSPLASENPFPLEDLEKIVIFGEWCGGNIQKGVAITGLPKMFVYFAIKAIGKETSFWLDLANYEEMQAPQLGIYNVHTFGKWELDIDFNNPQLQQNTLGELTIKVEEECPAGKYFNVSGVGEGIVWQPITKGWRSSDFWFKVKGEKHSVSKVKTLAPVDTEAFQKIADFITATVTEERLEQGLKVLETELLLPLEMKSLGDFIRWVYNDILKEETDTIVANQFDTKKLGGPVANAARPWYIQKINERV